MSFLGDIGDFLFGWLIPDPPQQELGTELTKAATDAPIPKIYGNVKKHQGTIIFKSTNDVDDDDIKNDLLHIIIVWAESVTSIDKVYLDDIDIEFDSSLFVVDGNRYAYARNFPNGIPATYRDAALDAAGWRSTDLCSDKACTYIRLEYSGGENLINNEPKITADITGTPTSNPGTHLKDLLNNARYGKGHPDSGINIAAINAVIATSNTQVENIKNTGVMRDLFTCNIALDTSNTVFDNVNMILKSFRGLMPVSNGKLKPIVEQDDAVASLAIAERDILQLGDIRNSSKSGRYNRVVVSYLDSEENATKQEAVYPPKDSTIETTWLDEDNGVLLEKTTKLETCNNYYEALAFAKSFAEISREQLNTEITLPIWATLFEVGDIVNVTHSKVGWNAKPFRIDSATESDNEVVLSVREHQPYIYDFENTETKPSYPDTSSVLTIPATPQSLTKLDVYNNLKQIDITWTGTTTRYEVLLKNAAGDIIHLEQVARKKIELRNLAQANYTIAIRAVNSIGMRSLQATLAFAIDQDTQTFVWTAYATSDNGANISLTDSGQAYIGFAYGQYSATPSVSRPAVYGFILRPEDGAGSPGANGKSIFNVNVFKKQSTEPAKPADDSASFNFTTNVLTPPSGWTLSVPTGDGIVWVTTTTFIIIGNTGVDSTCTFSAVSKLAEDGADSRSYREITIFRRSAAASLSAPTGGSFNFTTRTLTTPNLWFATPPTGTDPVFSSNGVASTDGSTGTDTVITWSTPVITSRDGAPGLSISYRGEFASPPSNPVLNWVYKNTGNGIVYIYNGSEWVVMVSDGNPGAPGTNNIQYKIRIPDGTAIKNGTGSITLKASKVDGGAQTDLASGDIRLYRATDQFAYWFTEDFNAAAINGSVDVILKSESTGFIYDSVTLVDITDGIDAFQSYLDWTGSTILSSGASWAGQTNTQALTWVQSANQGAWVSSNIYAEYDTVFVKAGVEYARRRTVVKRTAATVDVVQETAVSALSGYSTGRVWDGRATASFTAQETLIFSSSIAHTSNPVNFIAVTGGDQGFNVYITYHDNSIDTEPAKPVNGTGNANGWDTASRPTANWLSQKVAASESSGVWGDPIQVAGRDGENGEPGPAGPPGESAAGGQISASTSTTAYTSRNTDTSVVSLVLPAGTWALTISGTATATTETFVAGEYRPRTHTLKLSTKRGSTEIGTPRTTSANAGGYSQNVYTDTITVSGGATVYIYVRCTTSAERNNGNFSGSITADPV